MARALAGNAASAQALEAGRRARPMAELGWKQVERSRAHEATARLSMDFERGRTKDDDGFRLLA